MVHPVSIVMKLRIISRSLQTCPAQKFIQIELKYGHTQFNLCPYPFHRTRFLETQQYSVALRGDLVTKLVKSTRLVSRAAARGANLQGAV